MNNAKFTPGPWAWDEAKETIISAQGIVVWELGANEANNHLIAAAPDMYLVLTDIRDFLRSHGYDTRLVRAVLDKAEGK